MDKNLKHHGLIQALSRTNRVFNDSKPWGNILDFRYQESEVDDAIKLFSGAAIDRAREIWLVDPAPKVVEQYKAAVGKLETFMAAKGLACEPSQVVNLKGDTAKAEFINHFKEVQKLKTQLEQYTDLDEQGKQTTSRSCPPTPCAASRPPISTPRWNSSANRARAMKRMQRCSNWNSTWCCSPPASSTTTTSWR